MTMLFKPCYECTDFHLTVTTQIGIILGLQNYTRPTPPPAEEPSPVNVTIALNVTPPPPLQPQPSAPPVPSVPPPQMPVPPMEPPPWNYTEPPPPIPIFSSNRSLGYNCSHPDQAVAPLDLSPGAVTPPFSLMSQPRPRKWSIYNAFPRILCPTDDDADGLRYLYPECEEMLECEELGGAEKSEENATACVRFMPNKNGEYSILDVYGPVDVSDEGAEAEAEVQLNQTEWAALPFGRAIANQTCTQSPYRTEMGRTGWYRIGLSFYYSMLPPILILILAKVVGRLCLRMPWMARTRKRNAKLQRTAAKRKAEVRRMTEGGQEYAVKRAARITGQADTAHDVLASIAKAVEKDAAKGKKDGSDFLNKMKKPSPAQVVPEEGAPAGAPPAPAPARTIQMKPPPAEPSFADQMKAMTARESE